MRGGSSEKTIMKKRNLECVKNLIERRNKGH